MLTLSQGRKSDIYKVVEGLSIKNLSTEEEKELREFYSKKSDGKTVSISSEDSLLYLLTMFTNIPVDLDPVEDAEVIADIIQNPSPELETVMSVVMERTMLYLEKYQAQAGLATRISSNEIIMNEVKKVVPKKSKKERLLEQWETEEKKRKEEFEAKLAEVDEEVEE